MCFLATSNYAVISYMYVQNKIKLNGIEVKMT